ncbi:MAG: hypothetical protein WCP31_11920 [Chloroflexales bacterium]
MPNVWQPITSAVLPLPGVRNGFASGQRGNVGRIVPTPAPLAERLVAAWRRELPDGGRGDIEPWSAEGVIRPGGHANGEW